jgi:methionine biosynthesis protein MetW
MDDKNPGAASAPATTPRVPRWQDAIIEREIPAGSSVLDLGCGSGELLSRLIRNQGVRGQGVELDPAAVVECVARGVPVFHIDLDRGLTGFADRSFDYVIMEETLQTLRRPLEILQEMLRVGRHGIVSFPNFAYWKLRFELAASGRMPVTESLPHRWYDSPNIHLFTLEDFLDWARERGVMVRQGWSLVEGEVRPLGPHDNLQAEEVLLFTEME